MQEKIEVSVYQHPAFEEGTILFQEDVLSALLAQCETIYLKTNPKNSYPREEVEQRFTQLLQAVSLEKSLRIEFLGVEVPWEELLDKLKRYYPQMVWTSGKKIDGSISEYSFAFIPLVENLEGFPFGTVLAQSLIQQGVPDEDDPVDSWEKEIFYILEDYLRTESDIITHVEPTATVLPVAENDLTTMDEPYFDYHAVLAEVEPTVTASVDEQAEVEPALGVEISDQSEQAENTSDVIEITKKATHLYFPPPTVEPEPEASTTVETEATAEPEDTDAVAELQLENERLKNEQQSLKESNDKLQEEISQLNEQAIMLHNVEADNIASGNTMVLNKQALYYEEALRRERDAKERMRVTNDKLEHLVSRLERQVMENSLDIIDGEVPYVERSDDWYQKKHIDLLEYDQLYQKAKYLEHTWEVNQRLIVISERMTIGESEMKYERERVNRLKHSTKDIELFVMMDECRMINERVKIRPAFLWLKPRVTIMNGDYENLVEKAAYFDVIQSENQMLEKIIDEHIEEVEKE